MIDSDKIKIYLVGGAVRDQLLGLPVKERDYVVVGATPEEMVERGFKPVGRDFPVFLHPATHEEYALARTERKTGRGYLGFTCYTSPDISLEEDLLRRDLTINAMAMDEQGKIIDPYGGRRDLQDKILRHVSPAFIEDPVRILRLARFAAKFADFSIASETMQLMRQMVKSGEVDALVPERVLQEFFKTLPLAQVNRFFEVLKEIGALTILFPEFDRHYQQVISVAQESAFLACAEVLVRFSSLTAFLTMEELNMWRKRHNLSKRHYTIGKMAIALYQELKNPTALTSWPNQHLALLEDLNGFRQPELFGLATQGVIISVPSVKEKLSRLLHTLERAISIKLDRGEIEEEADKTVLKDKLHRKRLKFLSLGSLVSF